MYYCQKCGSFLGEIPGQFCPNCGSRISAGYDQNIPVDPAWAGQEDEAMRFTGRMKRPELKRAAKGRLSGNWGKAIGLGLVLDTIPAAAFMITYGTIYTVLLSLAALLIELNMSEEALFFLLLSLIGVSCVPIVILLGPLRFGNDAFYLQLFRERKPKFSLAFRGFDHFGKSCWMGVLKFLMLAGWTLLLVVPGVIKQLSYSMSYFILRDHPEMTAREAITASKEMMEGNKGELFVLHLSFIGWYILNYFTYGILEICYLGPYRNATLAAFYEELKARQAPKEAKESELPLWSRL